VTVPSYVIYPAQSQGEGNWFYRQVRPNQQAPRQFGRALGSNLVELLRKDIALARTEFMKHTGEIRMTPRSGAKQRFYVAEGNWDLLGRDPILAPRYQSYKLASSDGCGSQI